MPFQWKISWKCILRNSYFHHSEPMYVSTYQLYQMGSYTEIEIELLHSAWEWRYVSTVTFSQSHRHLLQNIITRNLHSKCLLSAMLLWMALVSDFISIKLNLFKIYNFAQFASIQNPTNLAHESSIKVKHL